MDVNSTARRTVVIYCRSQRPCANDCAVYDIYDTITKSSSTIHSLHALGLLMTIPRGRRSLKSKAGVSYDDIVSITSLCNSRCTLITQFYQLRPLTSGHRVFTILIFSINKKYSVQWISKLQITYFCKSLSTAWSIVSCSSTLVRRRR